MRADPRRRRSFARAALAAAGAIAAVVATTTFGAPPATADGPATFSNTTAISIPATGLPDQMGPASPFPSTIAVSGLSGLVSHVTVALNSLTHSGVNDIDVLLVAPTGENVVLLSDAGDATSASAATLTFDDTAAATVPGSGVIPTGTYRPTNVGEGDPFPAPAPTGSGQTTLTGAFTGIAPNGQWSLYVVDDATRDVGSIAGGWSLSITTDVTSSATTTAVTTSLTPSATGGSVTFTATVLSDGTPVTAGTVQFSDGEAAIGAPVALSGAGTAAVTTSVLAEGTHRVVATYSGATGLLTSNGSVSQRVDNPTTVAGSTYCNTGPLSIPSAGIASPYPSNITVTGATGTLVTVTATLNGFAHGFPADLDIMLAAPSPATNLLLMSDTGGNRAVSGLTLTFDDAATGSVPSPITSGTFRPTNVTGDDLDTFPAPAPVTSSATALSTFAGGDPNGTWSLWILDGAVGDGGSIAGGWCITLTTTDPTATALTSSANPSTVGQAVTFTATVTSAGMPVTTGEVQFGVDGLAQSPAVAVAADGTATFTTSALAAGTHQVAADYAENATYSASSTSLSQVVQAQLEADAGGPYTIAEGEPLILDASGSSPGATFGWDLDGDGDYTDATGAAPALAWAELGAFGIDDGPSARTIAVRVTDGSQTADAEASITVANTAPTAAVTGALTATVGVEFTVKVGAEDPSTADMAEMFAYTIDWGDGSPIDAVDGPADPPVRHTYAAAGTYSATFTATDRDGGQGDGTVVQVQVQPAAVPPGDGDLAGTGGGDPRGSLLAAAALIAAGELLVLAAWGRRRRARSSPPR